MQQFILGVGAAKAGTTWLHRRLSLCTSVDTGFLKEYHVFDSIERPNSYWGKKRLKPFLKRLTMTENLSKSSKAHRPSNTAFKLASFIDNSTNYFEYMHYLYLRDQSITTCCDITPAYSSLKADSLKHIKDGLESRGFQVKVFFLMRDPIDRIESGLKMSIGNRLTQKRFNDKLNNIIAEKDLSLQFSRGKYHSIVPKLEYIFGEKNIYYGFFESLFSKESVESIGNFTSLEIPMQNHNKIINPSKDKADSGADVKINLAQRKILREIYNDAYIFCMQKFGEKKVGFWKGYS